MRTRLLATISGLVIGVFLDLLLSPPGPLRSWELYQLTLLLGGIGLGGVFPEAWLWGPLGMAAARFLMFLYRYGSLGNVLALLFILAAVPAPLVGGTISRLLRRIPVPRLVYYGVLATMLAVSVAVPRQTRARSGASAVLRDRLEAEGMPALLKRIYQAEMAFSAGRRDRSFTCNGDQLSGAEMGTLAWETDGLDSVIHNSFRTQGNKYYVRLECPDSASPDRFRVTANPSIPEPSSPTLSIDQGGELTELASTAVPRSPGARNFVQIIGVSPDPRIDLARGQPPTFRMEVLYDLSFKDSAFLVMRTVQHPDRPEGCSGDDGEFVGEAEVPLTHGKHTVRIDVPWSGDNGQATRGRRVYGTGFLSFAPSIWEDGGGRRGKPLDDLDYFGSYRDLCYSFGGRLVTGAVEHPVTEVAVAQDIRVRLIDIESGRPVENQILHLTTGAGKEVRSQPGASPLLVSTSSVQQPSVATGTDGIAHFRPPGPIPRLSREISLIKLGTYISAYSAEDNTRRYVSCAAGDERLYRAEDVLKAGIIVKDMHLWCSDKKPRDEVTATPGEIVLFVRSLTGMSSKEIRVRVIDIETGKPAKDVDMDLNLGIGGEYNPGVPESLGIRSSPNNSRLRMATPRDGVVRYNVPAALPEKAGEVGLISISSAGYPSSKRYVSCSGQIFRIDEVLKHGVTVNNIPSWCPNTKALDEVNAAPGEIVTFVRQWTWRERIQNFFRE